MPLTESEIEYLKKHKPEVLKRMLKAEREFETQQKEARESYVDGKILEGRIDASLREAALSLLEKFERYDREAGNGELHYEDGTEFSHTKTFKSYIESQIPGTLRGSA